MNANKDESNPIPLIPEAEFENENVPAATPENDEPVAFQILESAEPDGPFIAPPPASPPPRRNFLVEHWKKVGGGSFMVSLLIHAGLLVSAYFVVETITHEKKVDFLPGGGTQQGAEATQQLQSQVQSKKRSSLNKQTSMRKVVSNSANASISLPDMPSDNASIPEMSSFMGGGTMGAGGFGGSVSGSGFGKGVGAGSMAGFTALPPTLRSRCSADERLRKLQENGGTSECERAVSASLAWLKTQQNPDGSWGKQYTGAMTGLALLCYLGRCETPDSPFYGDNVMKGILYLIELSKKNEQGVFARNVNATASCYEHGIATYALGEMYTMARMGGKTLPGMREAFEKGVQLIIKNQGKDGGWRYSHEGFCYDPTYNGKGDLSATGWQYQALKAAKYSNLKIDGLHKATDRAVDYLKSMQNTQKTKMYVAGGFGNTNREAGYNQWNLTGAGILGLQTLGQGKSSRQIKDGMEFAMDFFTKEPPDWNKNCNLYTWYYYAQVFFQNGGKEWKNWNDAVLPQILKNQKPDGSWNKEVFDSNIGSTEPGGQDKNLYRTALCTLMMEVYYRYLKVGDREEESIFGRQN